MARVALLVLICAVFQLGFALSGKGSSHVTLEGAEPVMVPADWRILAEEEPELDHPVEIMFAIKHERHPLVQLEKFFWAVSDPR